MSGGFQVYGNTNQSTGASEETKAKFEAMNKYVVETVGLEKQKTLVGVISAIVDLGSQPLPDSEYVLEGDQVGQSQEALMDARTEDEIKRGIYYDIGYNGNTKQREVMKKVPQKPQQCVAIAVDFPSKMIDKGQFFDEEVSKDAPLRIWYGGKYWNGEKMVIQNLTSLKQRPITQNGKDWSLNPKSVLHKMAVAAELVEGTSSVFRPERLDELLGKAFLFTVQVGFENGKGKNAGKQFYKEKVNFTGALMEGMPVPVLERTNLVMLGADNDEQAVKEIPAHIRNTIAQSKEFAGSKLEAQLKALVADSEGEDGDSENEGETSNETATETQPATTKATTGKTDW